MCVLQSVYEVSALIVVPKDARLGRARGRDRLFQSPATVLTIKRQIARRL